MKKHVPEVISMIVVPFFSLVPAVLLAHTVIGPFGRMIGDGLAKIIQIGFDSSFSWIVSGIYGLCYPLMVITGLHHAMLPIDLQAAEVVGGIYTFPVVALNNIAQASAVVAFVIINRKSAKAKEVGVPAFLSMKAQYMFPYIGVQVLCVVLSVLFTLMLSKTGLNSENRKSK